MQVFGAGQYQNIFFAYVWPRAKILLPNIEKILAGWTIYLGYNPTPSNVQNANYPHTAFDGKYIYLPAIEAIPGDNDIISNFQLIYHEGGGHVGHYTKLGDDRAKWEEWARTTGRTLDLNWQYKGNYYYCPAYEQFAWDVHDMIIAKTPVPYYMQLFNLQYQILTVGSKEVNVNGELKQMDVSPIIINNRTYVPLRFTHEGFKDSVDYDTGKILLVREGGA